MKKFGFGKKGKDGEDDPNRSALFGKKASPAPSENPYARSQSSNDPYMSNSNQKMTPYQQARANLNNPQAAGGPGRQGYSAPALQRNHSGSSAVTAPPPYSETQATGGYGNDRFGTSSGYGSSKYANAGGPAGNSSSGTRGPGGYGGFGRTNSDDTDANRDALFSGVQQRRDQRPDNSQAGSYGVSTAGANTGAYDGYGEQRELTEQEKEDLEVRNIRQETKNIRDASLASTENSLRTLEQTLSGGTETYARLAGQNEMLHNTNQHLDRAAIANRLAKEKTAELKTLNKSMFAVHVSNPFTSSRRKAEEEAAFLAQHREDRETRQNTLKDKFSQNARMEASFREMSAQQRNMPSSFSRANRADRYKYLDEDNSEDEEEKRIEAEKEDQIAHNQDKMLNLTKQLNTLARGLGEEISHSNKLIDEIGSKSDRLDDGLAQRTRELSKFK
ncbi:hypothetical protein DL770_004274 [Monosporascus sp. CRB-9-2]|nr:hypothetical protein DL770_004274 [Monosporascus sp. CRB-9-2]